MFAASTRMESAIRAFTTCCSGKVTEPLNASSWSLTKAMMLPEKLIVPITTLRSTVIAETATSAAAAPPTPLNAATICGIAVIWTLWAATAPITDPTRTPAPISTAPSVLCMSATKIVATSAITMPTAAMVFPERAVSGRLRRRMPAMKSAAATRYARNVQNCTKLLPPLLYLLDRWPEHAEHPVRHPEAADHVHRPEDHRRQADHRREGVARRGERDDRADEDYAVYGVRRAHERGVQQVGDARDQLEPQESRYDEDGHLREQLLHALAGLALFGALLERLASSFVPDLTAVRDARGCDDLILEVEIRVQVVLVLLLGPVFGDMAYEVVHVARIELAGVYGHRARQVHRAYDLHLVVLDGLPRLRELAVATALGREVHDDRPRLHALDHLLVHELRGLSARDERRGYDYVHLLYALAQQLLILLELLLRPALLFFGLVLGFLLAPDDVLIPRRLGEGVEA